MKILIVCSESDPASKRICRFLPKNIDADVIPTRMHLYFETKESYDLIIFPSKHESSRKINMLSCHGTGNFGEARYGGEDRQLSKTNAIIQSWVLKELNRVNREKRFKLNVSFEATHHGPLTKTPSIFIEIGSSEEQWNNDRYCSGIAEVITKLVKDADRIVSTKEESAIGFSRSHYVPLISQYITKNKIGIGHICPEYSMEHLNDNIIEQMIKRTIPQPTLALIEHDIKPRYKEKIMNLCKEKGLRCIEL